MKRRAFLRIAGGGVVMAAGVAGYGYVEGRTPPGAVAAWRMPPGETEIRRWVLSHALLAPNPHNLQPWIADLSREGEITLLLDPARRLPATDPFGRQIMMGAGAFLELLDIAAAQRGYRAHTTLFPQGEPAAQPHERPFAHVRLEQGAAGPQGGLYDAIPLRRTDRGMYDPAIVVTAADAGALGGVLAGLQVSFGTSAQEQASLLPRIREIVRRAWRIEMGTERTFMESSRLLRIGASEIDAHRDGITLPDAPLVLAAKAGLFDRASYPGAGSMAIQSQLERFDALTASTPAYLWITTEGNGRRQQVEAGRAYARVNLAGARLGLSMHPNEQSLQEYPEMADNYNAIHRLLGCDPARRTVQMLARLGRLPDGASPPGPAPRRGLEALIKG